MNPLKFFAETIRGLLYSQASDYIEMEVEELRHIFVLVVLGFLIGYPIIPPSLSLKLLPYMEEDVILMVERARSLDDQWGLIGLDIE